MTREQGGQSGSADWERGGEENWMLVLAPYGQDATLIAEALSRAAPVRIESAMDGFSAALADCSTAIITTDALSAPGVEQLRQCLQQQPAWSDLPIIVLTNRSDTATYALLVEALGNVTIIQRPLDPPSLVTLATAALRARQKQRQVRDLLRTELNQKAQIEGLNRQLLLAVDAAELGIWEVDAVTRMHTEAVTAGRFRGRDHKGAPITLSEWRTRIHPDDRGWVAERMEAALRGDSEYSVQYRTAAEGAAQPEWISSKALLVRDEHGEPLRLIGAVTNITESKRAEQRLRQRQQEIESLNERLKRAMTETHHRVKNSLQLISAFVDMQVIEHDKAVPMTELRRINTQVRTLAAVHDVLTHTVKGNGGDDLVPAKALLEKLLPMLQTISADKRLCYDIDDVQLPSGQGTSLALIANELVVNALKHSQSEVDVSLKLQEQNVLLTVLDDGPGLPDGFEVGRASNTGLALVENLAHWDLFGQTRYENRETGNGARIEVHFPATYSDSPLSDVPVQPAAGELIEE